MDEPVDEANVFAIPDFWKSSPWLSDPFTASHDKNSLFQLDLRDQPEQELWLGHSNSTSTASGQEGLFTAPPGLEAVAFHRQQVQEYKPGQMPLTPCWQFEAKPAKMGTPTISGRDHWPPASSELRLALMGVLAESYQRPALQATPATTNTKAQDRSLPGDISFGLRDLSAKEIDRCMDPNSLEALDFLRLTYKPPACLQTIMVPGILQKYDRLFQLLLRVQRMLYVTKQLYMDHMRSDEHKSSCLVNRRFCAEANHFVVQIATYFFDTGIERPWRRFELWLDGVENGLAQPFVKQDQMAGTRDAQQGIVVGPDQLREKHEQVLDEIMRTLLLRKRQLPVLLLLEEVFGVVLQFAKGRRRRTRGRAGAEEGTHGCETTEALYAAFRKKVEVFIMPTAKHETCEHVCGSGSSIENTTV
ncbi:hypothetical protein P8C59_001297 [Phyllachora maydis]|uniref:Spindle pole body component n=1 Tax=Phyllachora maydis TaxID=1825666 RepID=A0AAD9HXY2_9PEZI|nr:hypothetical protein P8C59_001297 [Phyllachora maydis]